MKRSFFCILFIIITSVGSFAQEPSKIWSLRDCMLYAIENSRKVKIQEATNANTKIDYRESYLKWIPQVSAQTAAYANFGRSIDPETNIYSNITSFNNSYSVSGNYTIFNGFSVVNGYKMAKIAKISGVAEYQQIEDNVCLTTMQSYFNVLHKIGMEKITAEQLLESKETLRQTKVMEELGRKSKADLLQVEAKVASDDYNHIKAENDLESELINLKGLMYYPLEQELTIDTAVVWMVDPFLDKYQADSIFASAKNFLPGIKMSEYAERTAQLKLKTATWQLLPNIYALGNVSTAYMSYVNSDNISKPFGTQLGNNLGEYVGIVVSIPIFNALSRQGNMVKSRNNYRIAQYQKEQKLQEVEIEITKAVQEMEGAAKIYIQADKKEAATEIAYQANVQKYKEGLISIIELQTSSNNLLVARAETLNAALTYLIKTKVVNYYRGIPYLSQE